MQHATIVKLMVRKVPYATETKGEFEGDGLFIATHWDLLPAHFLIVSIISLGMSYDYTANNTKLDAFSGHQKEVDSSEIYVSILIPFLSDFQLRRVEQSVNEGNKKSTQNSPSRKSAANASKRNIYGRDDRKTFLASFAFQRQQWPDDSWEHQTRRKTFGCTIKSMIRY
jgi:hypothetical protein